MRQKLRLGIGITITLVWAASYIASIVNPAYHPPPEVNAVMLLVAGFFFATWTQRREGDN